VEPVIGRGRVLKEEEWFVEGHGIIEGRKDAHGIWIPMHPKNGRAYIWSPPPIVADAALEECMKAVHKRTDAFHVFLIPRLYSPLWSRMFHKLSNFVFQLSPGLWHWPDTMHKPLFISISLPLLTRSPWTLRRMPLLVGMERKLCQVLSLGEADGRDILCQLLQILRELACMPEDVAHRMLRMSGEGKVPAEDNNGGGGEPVVLARAM
jgi:hypothetical protein